MRKNSIIKTLAGLTAVSVLGVSSMFAAGAAGESITIGDAEGKAGDIVIVDIVVSGNTSVDAIEFLVEWDNAELTCVGFEGKVAGGAYATDPEDFSATELAVAFAKGSPVTNSSFTLATLQFQIPEDAEAGTEYNLSWVNLANYADGNTAIQDTVSVNGGTITVLADEEETTTTEPEETTTAAVTTTTPTPSETGTPKTGDTSATGAVALLAVTAAAATAAVVLKKKSK